MPKLLVTYGTYVTYIKGGILWKHKKGYQDCKVEVDVQEEILEFKGVGSYYILVLV